MPRSLIVVFLLLVFLGCKEGHKENEITHFLPKHNPSYGMPATGDFEDLSGKPVSLKDFEGKRVVLNYWATWCRPCIAEMPSMQRAQKQLGEGYVFVLASDQSLETIKAFKEKKDFDFTYVKFNGNLADWQIHALPASFVYNTAGKLDFRVDGAMEWDAPENIQKLQQIP